VKNIVILGGARDYHAMDWYRSVKNNISKRKLTFLTDMVGGEGFDIIVDKDDNIENLFIIDKLLFSKQSKIGNVWRNLIKILVLPIQVYCLKKHSKKSPATIYHAHPMYYMLLSWLSGVDFIGTPQGSEILVRAERSRLYRYFAVKSLQAAEFVTVDSVSMRDKILELSGIEAVIVQNGIDIKALSKFTDSAIERDKVASVRGMTDLYRIDTILASRNRSDCGTPINFIYPFSEEAYRNNVKSMFGAYDKDLGRLDKESMYRLLSQCRLVISIPKSDSSPRSVYESIFLGACVAITHNRYFDMLPNCMKQRIYLVDLSNEHWFDEAVAFADEISKINYVPSSVALEMFDQEISMQKVIENLY
jgi:hypothetical protein